MSKFPSVWPRAECRIVVRQQRGAALLITAILLASVVVVAVVVAGRLSVAEMSDTRLHNDAHEALLLAESGLEIAVDRYAGGIACGSLNSAPYNVARELVAGSGKTLQITSGGVTTDYDGVTALARVTQCRVQVTGRISSTNVSRSIQGIIDKNLIGGGASATTTANADFDLPAGAATPTNWGLAAAEFDTNGGIGCSKSAYLRKSAAGQADTGNQTNTVIPQFSVFAPTTITVTFDYRVNANVAIGTATQGIFNFAVRDTTGTYYTSADINVASTRNDGQPAASPYSPCNTGYAAGRGTGTISVTGAGTKTMNAARLRIRSSATGTTRSEIWLDNIEYVNNTGIGGSRPVVWRDCSTAACL